MRLQLLILGCGGFLCGFFVLTFGFIDVAAFYLEIVLFYSQSYSSSALKNRSVLYLCVWCALVILYWCVKFRLMVCLCLVLSEDCVGCAGCHKDGMRLEESAGNVELLGYFLLFFHVTFGNLQFPYDWILDSNQVWSLTQFYSVDFSPSRIRVRKCVFA